MVVYTFNPKTWEEERGRLISLSSRPAWSTRASSRTGSKATEKPCLRKKKKNKNNSQVLMSVLL
ncbi:hypothetical protein LEMLEM_LOCUS7677 [Lemmus lemmus]